MANSSTGNHDFHQPLFQVLDKVSPFDLANIVLHVVVDTFGICMNSILLYIIFFHTPKYMAIYKILLINYALTEFSTSFLSLCLIERYLPIGFNQLILASYGLCQIFGRVACMGTFVLLEHCFTHSAMSLLLQFCYRYYVLYNSKPRRIQVYIALLIFSMPSILSLLNTSFFPDDPNILRENALKQYPQYYIDAATITGMEKLEDHPEMALSMIFICVFIPATYPFMFFLRHKILKRVEERQFSETTKRLHSDLLKYLNHPFTENLIQFSVAIIPAISPFASFFYITPYKERAIIVWNKVACKRFQKVAPLKQIDNIFGSV
ncbi:hypothetical protein WR25_14978 [Diploscapter pachys]|uniref:G-protein coupled receptors family 1 profile domain-containing protein n=1 Tax=Diploscapter pachys TaxID=2018661 RepID=A0A2A2K1J8_9BILA|nr:hypothetical protein WR25_14978 [Diploscapter pachys]